MDLEHTIFITSGNIVSLLHSSSSSITVLLSIISDAIVAVDSELDECATSLRVLGFKKEFLG